MLSRWCLDFSVAVRAFVIGLSQISSFFLYIQYKDQIKVGRKVMGNHVSSSGVVTGLSK